MSTLIDSYLLQLRSFLPARQREDIATELSESIRATVTDRESEIGRALTDDELAAVLKGYGHPLLVAGRYLPMQELIGPRVFPIYWYSLQAIVIVIAVITGVLGGIHLLTDSSPGYSVMQLFADFLWFALCGAAIVTLVFAIIDHESVRLRFLEDFDPRKLEVGIFGLRAAPMSAIARSDTVFEIATMAIFIPWWIGWLDFTNALGSGTAVEFTAAIEPFFWPVLALAVVDLARLVLDFAYPYRTPSRVLARLVLNVCWLLAFVLFFRTDGLIEATGSADGDSLERAVNIAEWILRIVVGALTVVTAVLIATDVVRLFRR